MARIEHQENGNIRIVLEKNDAEYLRTHDYEDDRQNVYTLLEHDLGNGWMEIEPKWIGALTDRLILSDNAAINDYSECVFVDDEPRLWVTTKADEYVQGLVNTLLKDGYLELVRS